MLISPRFPPTKLHKYPHMFPRDIAVWERFIDEYGHEYTGFDYDVKVGTGWDPGSNFDANIRSNAIELTKKRIDCVGYKPGEIWILEVKEHAGISAPGQVWAYQKLYRRSFRTTRRIVTGLVYESSSPDIAIVAKGLGVLTFQV